MVIADTSVWIPFFNRPDSPEKDALGLLIDADEVSLVGVVLAELLQGCRTPSARRILAEALLAVRYYEVSQATWLRAGDLSAQLLRKGVTLPLSDVIIAALALEHDCLVSSLDATLQRSRAYTSTSLLPSETFIAFHSTPDSLDKSGWPPSRLSLAGCPA